MVFQKYFATQGPGGSFANITVVMVEGGSKSNLKPGYVVWARSQTRIRLSDSEDVTERGTCLELAQQLTRFSILIADDALNVRLNEVGTQEVKSVTRKTDCERKQNCFFFGGGELAEF